MYFQSCLWLTCDSYVSIYAGKVPHTQVNNTGLTRRTSNEPDPDLNPDPTPDYNLNPDLHPNLNPNLDPNFDKKTLQYGSFQI